MMAISPVNVYGGSRLDLPDIQGKSAEEISGRPTFAKILSASVDTIRAPGKDTEKRRVSDIADILHLEMLHQSLSLSDHQDEAPNAKINRTINLYLESLAESGQKPTQENTAEAGQIAVPVPAQLPDEANEAAPRTAPKNNFALEGIISKASRRYGVAEGLIKAVIKAESNFNTRAVSSAGAEGLMQLMPATARGLGVKDSFDPEQNIMAGTRFLKDMLNRYDGDLNSALAAYNWGPGNVDKKGAALPRETRQYLSRVKGYYSEFSS